MTILKVIISVTSASLLVVIWSLLLPVTAIADNAQFEKSDSVREQVIVKGRTDSLKLSQEKVKHWIHTRIAEAKLQNKMKANAANYDNLLQAFYNKREQLLLQRGWTVTGFEAVQKRIHAALSAMNLAKDQAESLQKHEQQIAEIKGNHYLSADQKRQMIEGLNTVRKQEQELFIAPTKADWKAVRPYRDSLEHLTDWIAGNRPDPPVVK